MNRLSLYQIIFLIAALYSLLLNRVAASDIFFEHIQFSDPSKQKALNDLSVISQDNDGFMWFGGMQRLVRYDGIELKTYGPNPKDPDNLCGTFVQALFLDYQGILWVGAEHALCRYEKSLDIFVPFSGEGIKIVKSSSNSNTTSNLPAEAQKLSFAYALFEDGKHNLYIGENGRLLKLNALRNELSIYPLPDYMVSLDHISSIRSLYEDKDGQIWVGTSDSGLGKFDPKSETFHFYPHGRTDGTGTRGHRINSITQDVDGKLWLGQYLAGIDTFDPRTGEFSPQNIIQSSGSDSVWAIQQDKNHHIWMSSDGGGLLRYKPETKQFLTYRHQDGNPFSLIEDKTIGLYVDSDNNVWISQYPEGISYFHRNTEAIWNYKKASAPHEPTLNDNGVLSFLELPNGNILIGTEKGLNEYNPKTEKFKNWSDENTAQHLPQKPMTSIARDSNGNIWIGTWSAGIFRFNPHMQELKHFIADGQPGSLGANIVWDILPLENGEVFIATQGAGLNRYDPILDKFVDVRTEAASPQGVAEDLYCVIRDKNKRLWIGGTNGLHRFDPIEKKYTRFGQNEPTAKRLENLTIRSLLEDSRGHIWIGTIDKGVYLWTDDNKPLIHLGTEQGLPSIVVTAIQEDSSGEIWLATMKGTVQVDPVKLSLKTINSTHGLLAMTVNRGAFIASRSGTLYIGGIEGMSRFNPKELKPEKSNFPVKLTRLKIFNKEISPGDTSGKITDGLNQLKQLNLTYKDNMFAFDFAALNYHLSLQNQFAYMLEGFDKDWIYTGQKNNATYTNIPAGAYTFKVKAANSDNIWSDDQVNLPIYIAPSPWKTLPAYIAYGLIFIAVIFVLYRQQQARIHLKHERKINQALTRINEIKDAFLANTAHELRTPVGGMVGLATQLVEELDLPREANYKLELIISSGRRLSSLINDILDYSKMSEAQIELFKSWIDLHLLIEKIFSIVEPMAQNKKISLHNNTSCDVRVWADAARLEQMLLNLVSNAIKYSDSGSISVDSSALNGFLNIAVKDSGIGISPEDIEKLFIPFQQLKASAGRRIGGTGLGLAVTRFLVEQHGGEIKVESELGKGSTFILKMPLPKENPADVMAKKAVAQQSTLQAPNLAGEDVVYADDDVINCMLLKKQLIDTSANLHEANNGLAAWRLIQQYPALKFLFLDLQMPQLDGFDVAERQRASGLNDRLPIIFLTANITQPDIEKAKKLGITRILLKPITKQSLWQHMTELLEESAAKES